MVKSATITSVTGAPATNDKEILNMDFVAQEIARYSSTDIAAL